MESTISELIFSKINETQTGSKMGFPGNFIYTIKIFKFLRAKGLE